MHVARKVRAAPCGQRMSAFVHLSALAAAPSSSNGVPQRAWRAAQTRQCQRAIHVQLAPVCSHSKMGPRARREPRALLCSVIRAGSQRRPRYLLYVPAELTRARPCTRHVANSVLARPRCRKSLVGRCYRSP